VAICTAPGDQSRGDLVGDGIGGAIVCWADARSGAYNDIYAQWASPLGTLGAGDPQILSILDVAPDQGGQVRLAFQRSPLDSAGGVPAITSYGIWRRIPSEVVARGTQAGSQETRNDSLGTLYDFIVSVPAVQSPEYNAVVPTLEDSSSSGTHRATYLVTAHTANPAVFFLSDPDSGYSVDNLPPLAPRNLAGFRVYDDVVLHWNPNDEADLYGYLVYRDTSPGFDPDTVAALATTGDTTYTDTDVPPGVDLYYVIKAMDVHDNLSPSSNEVGILVAGVHEEAGASRMDFALHGSRPNPASGAAIMDYVLPRDVHVTIRLYDASGKLVKILADEVQSAGRKSALIDGAGLPSGVYFARLVAGEDRAVRKLVFTR
jgi:hypothetical protein